MIRFLNLSLQLSVLLLLTPYSHAQQSDGLATILENLNNALATQQLTLPPPSEGNELQDAINAIHLIDNLDQGETDEITQLRLELYKYIDEVLHYPVTKSDVRLELYSLGRLLEWNSEMRDTDGLRLHLAILKDSKTPTDELESALATLKVVARKNFTTSPEETYKLLRGPHLESSSSVPLAQITLEALAELFPQDSFVKISVSKFILTNNPHFLRIAAHLKTSDFSNPNSLAIQTLEKLSTLQDDKVRLELYDVFYTTHHNNPSFVNYILSNKSYKEIFINHLQNEALFSDVVGNVPVTPENLRRILQHQKIIASSELKHIHKDLKSFRFTRLDFEELLKFLQKSDLKSEQISDAFTIIIQYIFAKRYDGYEKKFLKIPNFFQLASVFLLSAQYQNLDTSTKAFADQLIEPGEKRVASQNEVPVIEAIIRSPDVSLKIKTAMCNILAKRRLQISQEFLDYLTENTIIPTNEKSAEQKQFEVAAWKVVISKSSPNKKAYRPRAIIAKYVAQNHIANLLLSHLVYFEQVTPGEWISELSIEEITEFHKFISQDAVARTKSDLRAKIQRKLEEIYTIKKNNSNSDKLKSESNLPSGDCNKYFAG